MKPRRVTSLLAMLCIASCASEVRLPYNIQINSIDRPSVVWRQSDHRLSCSSLELVARDRRTHLRSSASVFTQEQGYSPFGDQLQTFASPSGDTIVAHETATDASPEEQIVIFRHDRQADSWSVRSAFPAHLPNVMYGHYGVTKGVDDTYLYYHFPDGKLRRIRLDSLTEREMKHD
jgi:hypothetical protein